MKAAFIRAPREVVIVDVPVPEISDDEVLIEVKYCGFCGTDLDLYIETKEDAKHYGVGSYPGHEYSGVVAKVGKNVKGFKVGDRVTVNPMYICGECSACKNGRPQQCERRYDALAPAGFERRGAFAKFVKIVIPERRLHLLPSEVSFEEGAMVEPLASALHAVRISDFRIGEDTMVLGAGPMGLGVIAFLKLAGAGLIIATEVVKRRAEMAKKFGADYVFNPHKTANLKEKVLELTKGKGVDRLFECSGKSEAFKTATDFIRVGGQIMVPGCAPDEVPIIPVKYCYNEWELKGSLVYDFDDYPLTIEFLRKGVMPFKELVTKKIKLSSIVEEGYEVLVRPDKGNEVKILVEPDE